MPKAGEPKLSAAAIDKRRELVASLYLKGWTQAAIAEQVGVVRTQVTHDLKILSQQWQTSAIQDIDAKKALELAKIDRLEAEYWTAWDASKGTSTRSSQKHKTGQTETKEVSLTKLDRDGDPRYLTGVQWCIDRRCKMLGLDAPIKTELTGKDGSPLIDDGSARAELTARIDAIAARLAAGRGDSAADGRSSEGAAV